MNQKTNNTEESSGEKEARLFRGNMNFLRPSRSKLAQKFNNNNCITSVDPLIPRNGFKKITNMGISYDRNPNYTNNSAIN